LTQLLQLQQQGAASRATLKLGREKLESEKADREARFETLKSKIVEMEKANELKADKQQWDRIVGLRNAGDPQAATELYNKTLGRKHQITARLTAATIGKDNVLQLTNNKTGKKLAGVVREDGSWQSVFGSEQEGFTIPKEEPTDLQTAQAERQRAAAGLDVQKTKDLKEGGTLDIKDKLRVMEITNTRTLAQFKTILGAIDVRGLGDTAADRGAALGKLFADEQARVLEQLGAPADTMGTLGATTEVATKRAEDAEQALKSVMDAAKITTTSEAEAFLKALGLTDDEINAIIDKVR
jgi:hypothetical protein